MENQETEIDKIFGEIDTLDLTSIHGRITEVVGMLIKAIVPDVKIGEICLVKRKGEPLLTEVVGFTKEQVLLSPLGEMTGIGPSSEVIPTYAPLQIKVGPELLGRVLNGLGDPIDTETKGPLLAKETRSVMASPPDALKRNRVKEPFL